VATSRFSFRLFAGAPPTVTFHLSRRGRFRAPAPITIATVDGGTKPNALDYRKLAWFCHQLVELG